MRALPILALLLIGCGSDDHRQALAAANVLSGDLAFSVRRVEPVIGAGDCSDLNFSGQGVLLADACNFSGHSVGVRLSTADGGISPGTYAVGDGGTCAAGYAANVDYLAPTDGGLLESIGASVGQLRIDEIGRSGLRGSFEVTITLEDGGSGSLSGSFDSIDGGACLE